MLNSKLATKLDSLKASVLSNHFVFEDTNSEKFLEKRFSQEKIYSEDVQLEFSKDPEMLAQYYSIREEMYKTVLNDVHFKGEENAQDLSGTIILAKHKDSCVGGARINISSPAARQKLPMENDAFKLGEIFDYIDINNATIGEVSRVALLPKFADGKVITRIYEKLAEYCETAVKADVIFFATYATHARKVRQISSKLGYKMVQVNIDKPKHFLINSKVSLSLYAWDFTPDSKYYNMFREAKVSARSLGQEVLVEPEFA